jgi:hypothetical protein
MGVDLLSCWVSSADLVGEDGHCLSWFNPAHPGYQYPELSGLLLSFLCRSSDNSVRARQLHDALSTGAADDGVTRHGITSAVDTAMALRGLIEYRAGSELGASPVPQWTRALVRAVSTATATWPPEEMTSTTSWSMAFGAHEAKIAAALVAAERRGLDVGSSLDTLRNRTLGLQDERGRFRIHAASTMTYLHAQCYALEGLLMTAEDHPGAATEIRLGISWLASVQELSGGWQAWHDGTDASGPERSDVTAQAIRLMRLVDADRYEGEILAADAFLAQCQGDHPGLPYEPGSSDITSWSTLFAAQALAPAGHALRPTRATDIV